MKEVTKEEFYKAIYDGKLDVHPYPEGDFPYTSEFRFKNRNVWGKAVDEWTDGIKNKRPIITKHYIA